MKIEITDDTDGVSEPSIQPHEGEKCAERGSNSRQSLQQSAGRKSYHDPGNPPLADHQFVRVGRDFPVGDLKYEVSFPVGDSSVLPNDGPTMAFWP